MSTAFDTRYSGIEDAASTELAHRSAGGIDVLLLCDRETGHLRVAVDWRRRSRSSTRRPLTGSS